MGTWGTYIRLSEEDVRGGQVSDANSIDGQRRICASYIKRHDPKAKIVEFAEEAFISASQGLDRPAYVRMLEAVANQELDHIVARDQDRFTRDRDIEFGQLKLLAKQAGVGVHATDSGPLFDNLASELASGIRAEFGAFFAKITGKNTRGGLANLREQGKWTGAKIFGYSKGGVVNEEQADHIRWAYRQILDHDWSVRDVFEHWRANDIRTVNDKPWTSVGRVIAMLTSPTIAGIVTYRSEPLDVEAQWDAIVSPDDQERLRAVLRANIKGERGHGQRKPRRKLLGGLVLCGNPTCDLKVMNSQDPGNGRPYYYWHCDRRRGGCGNRTRGPELETLAKVVAVWWIDPTEHVTEHFDDEPMREIEAQISDIRAELVQGTMRAADARPVLAGLHERLEAENEKRKRFMERETTVKSWLRTKQEEITEGTGVRNIIDNIRVLVRGDSAQPEGADDGTTFIFEGVGGQTYRA